MYNQENDMVKTKKLYNLRKIIRENDKEKLKKMDH